MTTKLSRLIILLFIKCVLLYLLGLLASFIYFSDWGVRVVSIFNHLRLHLVNKLSNYLFSPIYELILGITLGVNELKSIPRFNDVSISLGLIHILVVSGYNINLVINLVFKIVRSKYNFLSLFTALLIAIFYALIVGLSAPVLRAAVMSSMFLISSSLGRYRSPLLVLVLSLSFIVGFDKTILSSLSLQLSYLASFGLIVLYNKISLLGDKYLSFIPDMFRIDLAATISAQLFTAPLIFLHFNEYSTVSVLANMLLLFFIPILTTLSIPLLFFINISAFISNIMSYVLTQISLLFFFCCDLLFILFSI